MASTDAVLHILDNTVEKPLSETIMDLLPGASRARMAVGYLFLEGLSPLVEGLAEVPRIELLIGNVVNRLTDEQIRESGVLPVASRVGPDQEEFAANYRDERNRAATETALNLRRTIEALKHTDRNRALLLSMARWILEGRLKVRLYTQHRLHAKVTLFAYPEGSPYAPGRAIVGTSNFTMPLAAALETSASNIDILVEGAANVGQLTRWFDWHWTEAQDFHRDLFGELGRAWALTPQE